MVDGPLVAGVVLAAGVVAVGGYFYIEYLRHGRSHPRTNRNAERLPLFGVDSAAPDRSAATATAPSRMPRPDLGPPRRTSNAPAAAPTPTAARADVLGSSIPMAGTSSFAPPARAYAGPTDHGNGTTRQVTSFPGGPRYADGETLRFALPDEGTLQFLPGRLQVVAGPEAGREIRFVRSPNTRETDVSFGRSEGPPHRHVQLLVPTVSRRHALMSLIDEHWSLQNLSATNPVLHNGRALRPDEVVPLLVDGDRIEMGEIVFVFHGR